MSDEWIKRRANLRDYPRLRAVASALEPGAVLSYLLGGVTPVTEPPLRPSRAALLDVAEAAVCRVWAAANAHGRADRMDVILRPMRLVDVDEIAGLAGVAWAMVTAGLLCIGEDCNSLILPNFLEHNEPLSVRRAPLTPAQRSRSYRDRKKGGGPAVTPVTNRHEDKRRREESREEDNTPPPPGGEAGGGAAPKPPRPKRARERNDDLSKLAVVFPPALDTDTFRAAYQKWLAYRQHRKRSQPLLLASIQTQIDDLGAYGEAAAVAALRQAEGNGWAGVFPEKIKLPAAATPLDDLIKQTQADLPDWRSHFPKEGRP